VRCRLLGGGALVWGRLQNAALAGELVAVAGDRVDQLALRPESGAQRLNLGVQIFLLDDPIEPHARHQRILAEDSSARLDQHVESAPAEVDRPAVGEELAAMRQHPQTTERDARRRFAGTVHQPLI
jgi:hypothetical protein